MLSLVALHTGTQEMVVSDILDLTTKSNTATIFFPPSRQKSNFRDARAKLPPESSEKYTVQYILSSKERRPFMYSKVTFEILIKIIHERNFKMCLLGVAGHLRESKISQIHEMTKLTTYRI